MSDNLFEIRGGPSREELFDSLRLSWENRQVEFTVENTLTQQSVRGGGVVRGIMSATEYDKEECWLIRLENPDAMFGTAIFGFRYYPVARRGFELPPDHPFLKLTA